MPQINPQWMAKDDIRPSRFVMSDLENDFSVVEATANRKTVGVSQQGTNNPPIPSESDDFAAISGETLRVHGLTEECLLKLGGTVVVGDDLKSDSAGRGVVIAQGTSKQEVGALALQSGTINQLIRVQVERRVEGSTGTDPS